jgi:phenylalanyl-tRNA synthetase beta chain
MMISLKWISDFVDVNDFFSKPQELAALLTAAGLEIEAIQDAATAFKNVVVGHIVEKGQHPDADRLTLCRVDVGEKESKQIVCGARNHKQGDKVVVALPGAILPGNFEIKLSKIRGVESSGMLCSQKELGFSEESEGILILPADAPVGKSFAAYYGLDDILFEVNVTPNRADCLSHFGLAREIACLLDRPLKKTPMDLKPEKGLSVKSEIKLSVKNADLCPRYMARLIRDVKVKESPAWLKKRLEAVGMNSINNVVDVTNYVMMEYGQPLHAFDADQLAGREVIVDTSRAAESFTTLDGTELKLSGEELTIRDAERAVCLAGVVGGKNSGVSETTKNVFLEAAHFTMESVRKTSRKFGLQTDSAYRFSRGTDITQVDRALNRAAFLLASEGEGKVSEDFYDLYALKKNPAKILVHFQYVADRLGYPVNEKDFVSWMERLGAKVLEKGAGQALFEMPSHRGDLEAEVDLVEEFGRLNGYDKIPEELPVMHSEPLPHDPAALLEETLVSSLMALGYAQVVNYAFTSEKAQKSLFGDGSKIRKSGMSFPQESVPLKNPLSEELGTMRVSLLAGLLQNLVYNYRYGNKTGRLFEVGSRYFKADGKYLEEPMLGIMAWGEPSSLWQKDVKAPLFFEVKAALEKLCQRLGAGGPKGLLDEVLFSSLEFRSWDQDVASFLHPGQAASIFCEGKTIGWIGTLHPGVLEEAKIKTPVVAAELSLTAFERTLGRTLKARTPSKYQMVERDLAFKVPGDLPSSAVIQVIKKVAGNYLQAVTVTDEFRGGDLGHEVKSLAFRMVLQDENGTLQDKTLLEIQNQIIEQAEKKLSVKLR